MARISSLSRLPAALSRLETRNGDYAFSFLVVSDHLIRDHVLSLGTPTVKKNLGFYKTRMINCPVLSRSRWGKMVFHLHRTLALRHGLVWANPCPLSATVTSCRLSVRCSSMESLI